MKTFDQIKNGMALAFFASAYADLREEEGEPMSGEIMDQLPHITDPAARNAAETLIMGMVDQVTFETTSSDEKRMLALYMHASNVYDRADADRELTPDLFGHYCAMQAMGTGVGLESFGSAVRDSITVPYVEFGSHSLQYDYD